VKYFIKVQSWGGWGGGWKRSNGCGKRENFWKHTILEEVCIFDFYEEGFHVVIKFGNY
jgi:hypothetical protein